MKKCGIIIKKASSVLSKTCLNTYQVRMRSMPLSGVSYDSPFEETCLCISPIFLHKSMLSTNLFANANIDLIGFLICDNVQLRIFIAFVAIYRRLHLSGSYVLTIFDSSLSLIF